MSEPEKEKTSAKKIEKKRVKRTSKSSSNAGVYILVVFVSVIFSAGLYWLWDNQKKTSQQQEAVTLNVNKQLDALNQQQQEVSKQNIKQLENLQAFQEKLRENLTKIVSNNQYFRNDWLIAEAEYLIQLASYRLLLEKDVTTAMVALKAADERLAEIADPALLKIREQVKKDVVALNNIQVVDLAGLSVTISALSNNISNLPLLTPDPKTQEIIKEEKASAPSETKSLQELPAAIWEDIKGLIIVRNHQKPVKPLLAPGQHFFLTQNLALLFEQARLALLNRNNAIYQERLQAITKWINQYFDLEHNITRNMLASIQELQKFDINPDLPDISSTFATIKKYRIQGSKPDVSAKKAIKK